MKIETGGQPFNVRAEELNEDLPDKKKPTRLGIALKSPVKDAIVTLTITPAP